MISGMKVLIQRVSRASVACNGKTIGSISKGLLLLVGISRHDQKSAIAPMAQKVAALRIFEDTEGKLNRSVRDINGEILVVSQFTLHADCSKGNRPSFLTAADPGIAEELYGLLIDELAASGLKVAAGRFRASMQVELINDGPATFMLESD